MWVQEGGRVLSLYKNSCDWYVPFKNCCGVCTWHVWGFLHHGAQGGRGDTVTLVLIYPYVGSEDLIQGTMLVWQVSPPAEPSHGTPKGIFNEN